MLIGLTLGPLMVAQQPAAPAATVDRAAAGNSPADPGPLATDVSAELSSPAIKHAMKKVADWQLVAAQGRMNQQWTYAALYDGLLAASATTGDPKYRDAVLGVARQFDWKLLDTRFPHADDEALGRAYLELYQQSPEPERIAAVRATLDRLIARPDDPAKPLWWWCDALFMAPPVLAKMYSITGDRKYLDFMDHEWWLTSAQLYDPQEHLYFRDERYFTKREANGQKIFWDRGNGWVLASLATILPLLPADYPSKKRYEEQFREMAVRVVALQQPDGLWRSGLLDPVAYTAPEVSGSAFFTYSLAWGVDAGLLDRKAYAAPIARAWKGLTSHIYADGRLGSIQPIDAAPGAVQPSSSYVYGTGAFLLAGSELTKMSAKKRE